MSTKRQEAYSKINDLCKPISITKEDILTLWQGFCTRSLSQSIKSLYTLAKSTHKAKSTRRKFTNFEKDILRKILEQGFSLWQHRNKMAIQFQKSVWNIETKVKNSNHQRQQKKQLSRNITPTDIPASNNELFNSNIHEIETVQIDNNNLHNSLYACHCGRSIYTFDHSLCDNSIVLPPEYFSALYNMYFSDSYQYDILLDPKLV